MEVKFIKNKNENYASLVITRESKETLFICHSNYDDGHYSYEFKVEGTEEEIKIIKEFCNKIDMAE